MSLSKNIINKIRCYQLRRSVSKFLLSKHSVDIVYCGDLNAQDALATLFRVNSNNDFTFVLPNRDILNTFRESTQYYFNTTCFEDIKMGIFKNKTFLIFPSKNSFKFFREYTISDTKNRYLFLR